MQNKRSNCDRQNIWRRDKAWLGGRGWLLWKSHLESGGTWDERHRPTVGLTAGFGLRGGERAGWKLAPRQVESQPSKGWGAPRTLGNVILVVAWTKGKYRGAAGDQLGQGTNPTKRPWQLRPALAEWEEAIRLGMQGNIFYFYIYTHICVLMGLVLLFKWESSHVYERHRSLLFN